MNSQKLADKWGMTHGLELDVVHSCEEVAQELFLPLSVKLALKKPQALQFYHILFGRLVEKMSIFNRIIK